MSMHRFSGNLYQLILTVASNGVISMNALSSSGGSGPIFEAMPWMRPEVVDPRSRGSVWVVFGFALPRREDSGRARRKSKGEQKGHAT